MLVDCSCCTDALMREPLADERNDSLHRFVDTLRHCSTESLVPLTQEFTAPVIHFTCVSLFLLPRVRNC